VADGWTIETLKEYMDQRLRDLDRILTQAQQDSREAVEKAAEANERRLSLLNEFRSQSIDEQAKFLPREIFDATVGTWTIWRASVEQRLNEAAGKSRGVGMSAGILAAVVGLALTFVGIVASVAVYFATH
jgi:hypothetical protein